MHDVAARCHYFLWIMESLDAGDVLLRKEDRSSGHSLSPSRAKRIDLKKTPPRPLVEQVPVGNRAATKADADTPEKEQPQVDRFLRTLAVVENERQMRMQGVSFPAGFPLGPYQTRDLLFEECKRWAANERVCGGAFGLVKKTTRKATSRKGPCGNFCCDRLGEPKKTKTDAENPRQNQSTLKTGCKWAISYEEVEEGWVISGCCEPIITAAKECNVHCGSAILHNHKLATTREEKNIFPTLRDIPATLVKTAEILHKAGLGPAKIYQVLYDQCIAEGIEISFTQRDIENKFAKSQAAIALDCTNLLEHLKERFNNDSDLTYAIDHDSDGRLNKLFFMLKNWRQLWEESNGRVVLYDTKHGTNRYGLKLGCFSIVDCNGSTRVIAASFVEQESAEMFSWVFECFARLVGASPETIFTDSDPAMAIAIKVTWPMTIHLLCIFHLWKNFYEHIGTLLKGKKDMWQEVATIFWKLAKTSDIALRQRFDNDFALITDKIATVLGDLSEKKKQDTQQWLESLRSRKESWAACYTWQHCLYGIHSTQRAESMHRVIADFCRKTHTIGEIAHLLENMAANQEMKSEMQMLKQEMTAQIHGREDEPFLEYIVEKLTKFAQGIVRSQSVQMTQYSCQMSSMSTQTQWIVSRMGKPSATSDTNIIEQSVRERLVRLADHGLGGNIGINDYIPHCTTLTSCSCQFPQCYGLPCRHIIRVLFDIASAVNEGFFSKALDMVVVRKWIKSWTTHIRQIGNHSTNVDFEEASASRNHGNWTTRNGTGARNGIAQNTTGKGTSHALHRGGIGCFKGCRALF